MSSALNCSAWNSIFLQHNDDTLQQKVFPDAMLFWSTTVSSIFTTDYWCNLCTTRCLTNRTVTVLLQGVFITTTHGNSNINVCKLSVNCCWHFDGQHHKWLVDNRKAIKARVSGLFQRLKRTSLRAKLHGLVEMKVFTIFVFSAAIFACILADNDATDGKTLSVA